MNRPGGTAHPLDRCEPAQVATLQVLIRRYAGLRVDGTKIAYALARAWPELAAQGVADVDALIHELGYLAGRLWLTWLPYVTINETYFMRETPQLEEFMAVAVPGLVARARAQGRGELNVLSAACSTGEEAYTLAILLHEAGVRARVTGVDVDPRAIAAAEAATYQANAFRGLSAEWRARRFDPRDDGSWWVKDVYRAHASFHRGNLLAIETTLGGPPFDAIFCRNVLIYFERDEQLRVVRALGRKLVGGGFLCLGHSELFFGEDLGLVPRISGRATMHQRAEA